MNDSDLALVLSGGGARAAYQVGFLRYLASRYPDLTPGILTGVSAGGIIAISLASREGSFRDSVAQLHELWLIELGESDARARAAEIEAFLQSGSLSSFEASAGAR